MKRSEDRDIRVCSGSFGEDDGVALPVVLAITVMLFVLATMLLTIVSQTTFKSVRREAHTKAVHMADAGINAYLYELRRNPSYYLSHATLGPTTLDDGQWSVQATPPSSGTPLTLRAVGTVEAMDESRTVLATVRFPTYADYMFLADSEINIGAGAVIDGKVRSNKYIDNDGRITGVAEAVSYITGSGQFLGGKRTPVALVDFAQVTADLADIRAAATAASTYFGPSSAQGYLATISGNRVTVQKVTSVTSTGAMTLASVGIYTIPSSGVFYFNDTVWVSGTYSAKITIASSEDIYVVNNLVPQVATSTATCGLIAAQNVIVPTKYTSVPSTMRLVAACLAQNGSVYGNLDAIKTRIELVGSLSYRTYGYFVQTSGSYVTGGWRERLYQYDPRLDLEPPPMFPQIKDGTLKISTWTED